VQAVTFHDDGWLTWEAEPKVNRQTDRPFNFTEMPYNEALTIWYRSPKLNGERDPYAGLLVSRHGTYLFSNRLQHANDPPDVQERIRQYLSDQETLRERLRDRLKRAEGDDSRILLECEAMNYALLRACDHLSLRFCTRPLESGHIFDAPVNREDRLALEAIPLNDRALTLRPWPFDSETIHLPVLFYDLPDRPFTTYSDLKSAIIASSRRLETYTLQKS
jgi:hypothetical protein